jgi:hypothetical protein
MSYKALSVTSLGLYILDVHILSEQEKYALSNITNEWRKLLALATNVRLRYKCLTV